MSDIVEAWARSSHCFVRSTDRIIAPMQSSKFILTLLFFLPLVALGACANTSPEPSPIPTPSLTESPRPVESTSPTVTQDVVTPELAESEQVDDQGMFLRVIAPLDESRGYCLDIPGHRSGVRLESPLHVHTCKHGIWNQDGRFDVIALGNGVMRMPYYGLCLQAENSSIGARLLLAECTEAELQTWTLQDSGEIALGAVPEMCITVEEGPGRDAGGPQYLIRSIGLDTCSQQASDRQRWTAVIPR